jgi:hypothetical protein
MTVAKRQARHIRPGKTRLKPKLPTVNARVVIEDIKPTVVDRQINAASIVPGPEFAVAAADEAIVGVLNVQLERIILVIENPAAVNFYQPFLADVMLIMKFLDTPINVLGNLMPLFESRFVPADEVGPH